MTSTTTSIVLIKLYDTFNKPLGGRSEFAKLSIKQGKNLSSNLRLEKGLNLPLKQIVKNKLLSSIPTNVSDLFILNDHLSVDEIVKNGQKLIEKHSQETLAGLKSKDQEYEDRIRVLERDVSALKLSKPTCTNSKRERCTKFVVLHTSLRTATGMLAVIHASDVATFQELVK
ncbi:hypothetical protein RF11_12674 [Thelohanellus kitauei]|uniref:Uncharacterized protein n=1 Tax=Thelohanellus kitauei TaxID=669202 RepID=A0A0C2NER8_THEKT|nr:hypothetical protein RF11_12674 [Thelohanellus kitauei]